MPCSLGSSSWTPQLSSSAATSTQKITPMAIAIIINPSISTPSLSTHYRKKFNISTTTFSPQIANRLPFSFTHASSNSPFKSQSCFASNSSALCLPEVKGKFEDSEDKVRIEHLVDKIKAIPALERSKFLDYLIEKEVRYKTIGYFNNVIMSLVVAEELDLALKLFDKMPLHGLSPDCWTYSILIRCYCKKSEPDEGKKLLDRVIENRFQPNVVTLTILVNSFCSRGKIQRAFEVMEMMGRFGCNPNVHTYNCVLKGLCFVGRIEEAYEMLMTLNRGGNNEESVNPDIYSYTAVMDGLCKVGRSDEAMELLEEAIKMGLTPNVVTYNTLFNGYCKEGRPRKGITLLKQMKERCCIPDYISYSTLLHGLLKWGKIMAAFWIYKEMVEVGFKVDERMMNTLLRGLCRKSWGEKELLKNVYQVFEKMKSWAYDIFPDTYNLVIQTFCIENEVDKALVTSFEMVEAGYFPRMVSINRIIRGLCEEGKISEAISILVLVFETRRIPSKISYNILIDELIRQGNVLSACNVYGAALKLGVIPHRMPFCLQQSRSHPQ